MSLSRTESSDTDEAQSHINPCLVIVQHRKTHSDKIEKLLTGTLRIKSNNLIIIEEYYFYEICQVDVKVCDICHICIGK